MSESSVAMMSSESLVAVMSSLLLLFSFCFGVQSYLKPNKRGELRGSHLNPTFIGETIVFTCNVTDVSLFGNSSSIGIRRSNSNTSIGSIVNQTATSATIEVKVTSPSDQGMYYCTLFPSGVDIKFAWVDVDYPLAPVKDLNCTVPPGRTQLGCTYTLPLPYLHPKDIVGYVDYYPENYIELRNTLYSGPDRNFSLPAGIDLFSNFKLQVLLLHKRRNVSKVSEEFSVRPIDVVIPPPIHNVRVTGREARRLQLSWQGLDDIIKYVYRVTYTDVWGSIKQNSTVQAKIVLEELSPFTNYSILVQGRDSSLSAGYWSQGDPFTVRTLTDVPGRAPRVSLAVSRTDDGRVVVYWQPLPPKEENGEMYGYSVQCEDEEERRVGPGRFSETLDIPTDRRGVWCDVYAINNAGVSPPSSLYIPSRRPEVTHWDFWVAVEEDGTNITFLWDLGEREQYNCTAYWCHAAEPANLCETPVQWDTVTCDQQNLTVDTGHVIADQRLMVGFSAQLPAPGGLIWGTIKWQYCVYQQHKVPPTPDGFRLSPNQPPLGVNVEWRPPDCRQNPAHITSYLLSYCPVPGVADHCSGSSESRVVDGDAVSYLISNLEPGAIYKVKLRAVSQVLQGPWSAPVIGRVQDASSPWKIILPVIAVFTIILGFILCFCMVKRARSSWKRGHRYWYPSFGPGEDPGVPLNHTEDSDRPDPALEEVTDHSGSLGHVVEEVTDHSERPSQAVEEVTDHSGSLGHAVEEVTDHSERLGHAVEEVTDHSGRLGHAVEEVTDHSGRPGHAVAEVTDHSGRLGHAVEEVADHSGSLGHVVEVTYHSGSLGQAVEEVTDHSGRPGQAVEEVTDHSGSLGQAVEEVTEIGERPGHAIEEVNCDAGPGQVVDDIADDEGPAHLVEEVTDSGGAINALQEERDDVSDAAGQIEPSLPNGNRTHLLKDYASVTNCEYVSNISETKHPNKDQNNSQPHSSQSYVVCGADVSTPSYPVC